MGKEVRSRTPSSILILVQFGISLFVTQSYALITRSVGTNGDYSSISSALVALSPFTDDVVLQVNTGFNGYGEPGGDYNSAVNFNGHSLDLLAAQPSGTEITYYVGSDVEYRMDVDGNLETVESVNGSAFSARRVYEGKGAASGTEYLVKNHLGSTVAMTDEQGHALGTYFEYAAYGTQDKLQSGPVARVTHTFTGKELDEGVDFYYFGARYYDPDLSMWISPDPVRQLASPYIYMGNGFNPITALDPDGNDVFIDVTRSGTSGDIQKGRFTAYSDYTPLRPVSGFTLEPSAQNSAGKHQIGQNSYSAKLRADHKPRRIELVNVKPTPRAPLSNKMGNAQIHNGNFFSNTNGCILVGAGHSTNSVTGSQVALGQINSLIDADGSKNIHVDVENKPEFHLWQPFKNP